MQAELFPFFFFNNVLCVETDCDEGRNTKQSRMIFFDSLEL